LRGSDGERPLTEFQAGPGDDIIAVKRIANSPVNFIKPDNTQANDRRNVNIRNNYSRRVRLFVCYMFVCPEHNSKTNDPKVFKLGIGNALEVVPFWSSKVKGQGHRVSKFILHTKTAIHRHSPGGVTSRLRFR